MVEIRIVIKLFDSFLHWHRENMKINKINNDDDENLMYLNLTFHIFVQ